MNQPIILDWFSKYQWETYIDTKFYRYFALTKRRWGRVHCCNGAEELHDQTVFQRPMCRDRSKDWSCDPLVGHMTQTSNTEPLQLFFILLRNLERNYQMKRTKVLWIHTVHCASVRSLLLASCFSSCPEFGRQRQSWKSFTSSNFNTRNKWTHWIQWTHIILQKFLCKENSESNFKESNASKACKSSKSEMAT